jgi:endo-1,4-beta-xylanase
MLKNVSLIFFIITLLSCNNNNVKSQQVDSSKGLKDYYADFFPIGVSVSPQELKAEEASLIVNEFNSLTAVNAMKMGLLQPKQNEYYWKDADSIVAFAKRNNLKLRGHTLVWHQQTPGWFFTDTNGKEVSKDTLLKRIQDHITTVVSRYKDDIYAWDVVNEVIADDKDTVFRNSRIFQICGEEFIAKAFEWAHAADPDAILFYNDYNEINPVKRAKIISLIRKLRASGIPVHAIGLQAHWTLEEPSKDQLEKTLKDFSSLGLPLQITELDVSVYSFAQTLAHEQKKIAPDQNFTSEKEKRQIRQYEMIFDLLRKYKKSITGITFWNVSDKNSWLNNFPVKNRKDHPLLFDNNLKPKKAYWKVVQF